MSADWPHPSFAGAFLPSEREVTGEGFTARWEVPHLARSVPQVLEDFGGPVHIETVALGDFPDAGLIVERAAAATVPGQVPPNRALMMLNAAGFGVDLYQPVDLYQQSERAAKYGILFIGLTFAVLFLMEKAATRPLHEPTTRWSARRSASSSCCSYRSPSGSGSLGPIWLRASQPSRCLPGMPGARSDSAA